MGVVEPHIDRIADLLYGALGQQIDVLIVRIIMIFGWLRCRRLLQIELDRGSEYYFFGYAAGKQLKRSVGNSLRRGNGGLEGYALSDSLVSWQIFAHLPGLFVSSFEALHEPSKCCQRTYLSGLACL